MWDPASPSCQEPCSPFSITLSTRTGRRSLREVRGEWRQPSSGASIEWPGHHWEDPGRREAPRSTGTGDVRKSGEEHVESGQDLPRGGVHPPNSTERREGPEGEKDRVSGQGTQLFGRDPSAIWTDGSRVDSGGVGGAIMRRSHWMGTPPLPVEVERGVSGQYRWREEAIRTYRGRHRSFGGPGPDGGALPSV